MSLRLHPETAEVFHNGKVSVSIGTCKLCLEDKELCKSHFMPQALFDLCRAPGLEPVVLTQKVIMQTSRQTTDYLLCQSCEDILNEGGESWVLPKLAKFEGEFPLYEIVQKMPPNINEADVLGYAASHNSEIDTDSIIHFAAGIFWKASVHPWKRDEPEPRIELGPYREAFRQFVLGTGEFPKDVVLVVGVTPPDKILQSLTDPYRGGRSGVRNFLFYVPGMHFTILVGKTIEETLRSMCFVRNPLHPILVGDFSTQLKRIYLDSTRNAHQSARIKKFLRGNRPE